MRDLINFWLGLRHTHPILSDKAVKFLIPFVTSYLCEQGFSSMLYVKNKYRTRMNDLETCLRLKLTEMVPNFDNLSSKRKRNDSC
jgi:hypothetical protein